MPQAEIDASPRPRAESGTSGDSWNFSESDTYFQRLAKTNLQAKRRL